MGQHQSRALKNYIKIYLKWWELRTLENLSKSPKLLILTLNIRILNRSLRSLLPLKWIIKLACSENIWLGIFWWFFKSHCGIWCICFESIRFFMHCEESKMRSRAAAVSQQAPLLCSRCGPVGTCTVLLQCRFSPAENSTFTQCCALTNNSYLVWNESFSFLIKTR